MRPHNYKFNASYIKDAINPHDFYLREQNLCQFDHRSGPWAISGLCPFHKDSKQGSFKVNVCSPAKPSLGICLGIIAYLKETIVSKSKASTNQRLSRFRLLYRTGYSNDSKGTLKSQ